MPKVVGGTLASHREHVINKIYAAMRTLLYERGYDALSLAQVAKAADMSRTAMYNYFPDKEALLVAFAIPEGASLQDTIESTEAFVLRAVGARLGPDEEPRKITRR